MGNVINITNEDNGSLFYFLKGTEPSYDVRDFEAVFKEENEGRVASWLFVYMSRILI